MKRTILILFVLASQIYTASSQMRIGVSASKSINLEKGDDQWLASNESGSFYQIIHGVNTKVHSLGMHSFARFNNLYLSTGLSYRKKESSYHFIDYSIQESSDPALMHDKVESLHVPIHAGHMFGETYVGVGPILDFVLEHKSGLEGKEGFHFEPRKLTHSFQFVVGHTFFNHVQLELKYERLFQKTFRGHKYHTQDLRRKGGMQLLTLDLKIML